MLTWLELRLHWGSSTLTPMDPSLNIFKGFEKKKKKISVNRYIFDQIF